VRRARQAETGSHGGLYLRDTGITALPENLKVGGSVDLRGTGVTKLPDSLTVGGKIYGLESKDRRDRDRDRGKRALTYKMISTTF
jgi:hypothetical protein